MTLVSKLPTIGITTYGRNELDFFTLPTRYGDAIQAAGGIPILLPPIQPDPTQILDIVDGLIFSGGGDIDPLSYGGTMHPSVYGVDPDRDEFELALAQSALKSSVPVLAICRGMQVFNVVTGGGLIAHIPDHYGLEVLHRLDHPRQFLEHEITIQPESRLSQILGTTTTSIVSFHHQALQTVAPEWKVTAQAADGLIEAIEHKYHPWLIGVQWHPEMSLADPIQKRLFQAFVTAASDRRVSLVP